MTTDSEEELKKLEEELKQLESSSSSEGYGSPKQPDKDSVFKFFREILYLKDSKKVGNLKKEELGLTRLGIRHYLDIANYAEHQGLAGFSDYLRAKSEIIAATSMSKDGFLSKLFVTQIKKEQKSEKQPEKKKSWFDFSKKKEDDSDDES